ncbi:MAG: alpha/beta hydrolase [Deltaproteobacteria bacterium]|nr:alpha/beta hydrolase [Deltaproteobacteria bacterium]MBW2284112.1 alpha/beta hydrolase [Deltaproteobacteria bacterium]
MAVVTFSPGFSVPQQPLKIAGSHASAAPPETPAPRTEVGFHVNGTRLSAWLFLPRDLSEPVPCIVMGHGFGGTKAMDLDRYAARFREAGFAVLAFDYRHLGESGGEPRQLVWIPNQLEDWQAAVTYARGMKEIDPAGIALWGTSMSGGHVIVTSAKDHDIACVVAQCPGLDGRASGEMLLKTAGIGHILKMVVHGQRDFFRSWFGLSPHKIPIVGKPGSIACLTVPDAWDGYRKLVSEDFINQVCARIVLRGDKYRPVKHARNVRCPVLLQVCEQDSIVPASAANETERELGGNAEVIRYPIGHFDIYVGEAFEKAVNDQLAFFRKHL